MDTIPTRKISAVISSEPRLEQVINTLLQHAVAHHDISVRGAPNTITGTLNQYFVPADDKQSLPPPTKEPFLRDDLGWLIGFAFSIPFIIGIVIGVFLIGDVRSPHDNFLFGILGGIVGGAIGIYCALKIKNNHAHSYREQEKRGGFVLHVTITADSQIEEVIKIIKKFRGRDITIE